MALEGDHGVAVFHASRWDELEKLSADGAERSACRGEEHRSLRRSALVADCLSPADPRSPTFESRCLQTSRSWNLRAERSRKNRLQRSVSDCTASARSERRMRSVSITDEDLDELRGTIDLGFSFSEEAIRNPALQKTLPALEFCSAIEHITQTTLSPPLSRSFSTSDPDNCESEHHAAGDESGESCACSSLPLFGETQSTWNIPKPGDNPQHVKRKLRHWAQAVGCITRIREAICSA